MDFFGNITSGNHLCFEDGLGKEYEQSCDTNVGGGRVPYCSNDLEVDWLPNGRQVLRIKRGCKQQTEAQSYCNEGGIILLEVVDCCFRNSRASDV